MNHQLQTLRVIPHLDSSQGLVFPIMEFDLQEADVIKIGRSVTEARSQTSTHMTFKSKVVSRKHAEIFLESGKVYLRDIQSSSGTFLNGRRLCPANTISTPFEVHDEDIIQLGVDYQGGTQEMFRSVKMKLQLNKPNQGNEVNPYNLKNFDALRHLTTTDNVDECCICLFAIAPFQALFVAPCSHTFHFKCSRPLLMNYPGFSCPLCRKYADLDANISIEVDEVKAMLETMRQAPVDATIPPSL